MADLVDRQAIPVLVAGEAQLLGELIADYLEEQGFRRERRWISEPDASRRAVEAVRGTNARCVVVLVDPIGLQWLDVSLAVRSADPRVGVLVLTARASYAFQRRWSGTGAAGVPAASGMLTLDHRPDELVDAVIASALDPRRTGFWLDGPRHPFAHRTTPDGEVAERVRRDGDRYRTLVLESQAVARDAIAEELGIKTDQITEHLNQLRRTLGVGNNVQLGRRASELGLLDDVDPDGSMG